MGSFPGYQTKISQAEQRGQKQEKKKKSAYYATLNDKGEGKWV